MPLIVRETITQTFLDRVKATPTKVGFQYKSRHQWQKITFRDFYEDCRLVSLGLSRLGIRAGDKVALFANTRYEWSLCDMAILGASAVTVPVYPSSTPADAGYILGHSDSRAVIVESAVHLERVLEQKRADPSRVKILDKIIVIDPTAMSLLSKYEESIPSVLTLDAVRELGRRNLTQDAHLFDLNLSQAKPSDPITICYTSGTSGVPKGAIITHESMMSVLDDCVEVLSKYIRGREISTLSFLPASHILGKCESMAIYTFGWKQAFAESLDLLIRNIQEIRPNLIFAVPRVFEKAHSRIMELVQAETFGKRKLFEWGLNAGKRFFASMRERKIPSIRDVAEYTTAKTLVFRKVNQHFGGRLLFTICGGAPLPVPIGEFFQIAGIKILEGYGLTETCGPIAVNTPADIRFGSVGRPLPEVAVKIAADGEILVKSKKLFRGYYKSETETAELLRDGWFHTGDIGSIDDDGFLHITDRKKDLIITSGGKNIAPQKIENLAKAHPLINQFLVYGDNRPYLTALITLDQPEAIRYSNANNILFSQYSELVKNPKLLSVVQRVIGEINEGLASYEKIKKFIIIPSEFTIDSGELTPSLKIKRSVVSTRYSDVLDSLYTEPRP